MNAATPSLFARLTRMGGRSFAFLLSVAVGFAVLATDTARPVENGLRAAREVFRSRPASGGLHIVEIDAASIARIDRWPWPRGVHAEAIRALHAAGARTIAFDVDFSAPSDAAQDARLARAIKSAGGTVILPTFRQAAGTGSREYVDALPAPALRDSAFLAAVSILPDRDGVVREAPSGVVTAGTPRPSLSAMLAGRSAKVFRSYPIDFAIEPSSIPRHSFHDVISGRIGDVRGKDILIGATAIELGDRYVVPRHGVIPGVVIQALAAETLRSGFPRVGSPILPLILAICLCGMMMRVRKTRAALVTGACGIGGLLFGLVAVEQYLHATAPIVPALAALLVAITAVVVNHRLARRRAAKRIDDATGLPNRLALVEATAGSSRRIVVAVIARFDDIASTIGSDAMARLILRSSERLALVVPGGTIFRVEDRMLAWVADAIDDRAFGDLLNALRITFLHPIEVDGRRIDVKLGLGVADGTNAADAVIASAAAAGTRALETGAAWLAADAASASSVERDLSLMSELNEGLLSGDVFVLFQPKLAIAQHLITSAEALVRWNHPQRGMISPDIFIPLAEQSDRIEPLTLFVLRRALNAIAELEALGRPVSIAVNISATLLSSSTFNAALDEMLAGEGDRVGKLIFEITESAAMADMETAVKAICAYRDRGITISMDDYGTGQSTLTYVKRLPLAELKIDRSFVQFAHLQQDDAVLVRSTIALAHDLGIRVVAEGVEDAECLAFLASCKCDFAQGWHVSKPVELARLIELCQQRTLAAA